MAHIKRTSHALWKGGLQEGNGVITSESRVLDEVPHRFETRFEHEPGTNPEELIAAAHAACFSMALAGALKEEGHEPQSVLIAATTVLEKTKEGFAITEMHLEASASVPEIDEATFRRIVEKADKECPVSNLLRPGLDIVIDKASLYT